MSDYKIYNSCRFCGKKLDKPVINLGNVPLAGGFLKSNSDFTKEKLFPLHIVFCDNCFLLQTKEVIQADKLFKNYFYHTSAIKTLSDHFKENAYEFSKQVKHTTNKLIVEIGCNDGTFIDESQRLGFKAVGVDPARNVVKPLINAGKPIINDYFTERVAKKIIKKYGQADIIFSSNTLAHIEDMHEVYRGIKLLMKDDGMLVFENHYLGNLIKEVQYDMIYHEHQYYYSLNTLVKFLAKHNLEVFDVKFIPIHAGSIKVYVQEKNGKRKIKKIVQETLAKEIIEGLTSIKTFHDFNRKIIKTKKDLLTSLIKIKKAGKTIAGYGASGRGTILSNYCGLDQKYLDYVIDDAPAKQGTFMPGTHLLIKSSDFLNEKSKPDYVLLFAWSFVNEILKRNKNYRKNGGKYIIPLPKVKII